MSNPAQRGGVAIGVPQTRVLCPGEFQARQFEYHASLPLMAVGTVDGSVVVVDWERNSAIGRMELPALPRLPHAPQDVAAVLALAWVRGTNDRLLAAAADGSAAMFKIDLAAAPDDDERMEAEQAQLESTAKSAGIPMAAMASAAPAASSCDPNALSLVHSYGAPLAPKLTSMHCNASGTLLAGSGYTHSVHISDLHTGVKLRVLSNIHDGHINIARFANHSPNLLLTCSFDRKLKLFDLRSNASVGGRSGSDGAGSSPSSRSPAPIYTCSSTSGVVMVTWSPNDLYFLSSAVDNEVRQFLSVDGRLHLQYDLPRHGCPTNYTRSYYANDGECIISGASNSDLLLIASSVDGALIDSVDMVEGRREKTLYIQSLRGAAIEHNRCAVLVFFKAHTDKPYELVDVNLNKDPTGRPRDLPMSLGSMRALSDDYRTFLNRGAFADVVISCQGASGDQLIYAHQAILRARWSWFRKWAQWSDEAIRVSNDAAAAAASATCPAAPIAASESQSLDDDEESDAMHVTAAASASAAAPLSFCRIQVPHASGDMQTDNSSSASAPAPSLCDTITLSSNGMVSLQLPNLSRAHCLYLLEYLYTGGIPIEAQSAAAEAAKEKADKAAADQRGQRAKESAAADFEHVSHVARTASGASAASAAASSSPSDVRGLDDDDEEFDSAAQQQAIFASLASALPSASPVASSPDPLDVHAALVALCMHATPATAATFTPSHGAPFTSPPLRASFAEQLALYVPTTAAHYDLPRLANILERSMRRLLTLSLPAHEVQARPCTGGGGDLGAHTSGASPHSHIDALAHQLRLCVRYGAHGLVQCAQDLIHKSIDWLEFSAPSFVAQLPSIFPPSSSNFLAELERARRAPPSARDQCIMPLVGCGSAVVTSAEGGSVLVCCGGFGDKSAGAADEIHVVHPQTLRVTALTCGAAEPNLLPDVFCSHGMAALQSANGSAMSVVSFGGGRDLVSNALLVLDLHTLRWRRQAVSAATPLPHGRRKHTLTAVPAAAFSSSASASASAAPRLYVFGGRNRHSVFADLHYFRCLADEWECVDMLEQARMSGHVPLQSEHPAGRYGHTLTYSAAAGGLVLFGGFGVTGARNDCWLFDLQSQRWERKFANDPSAAAGSLEEYEAGLQQSGGRESVPLPRFQHSALLVTVNGREQLAVFGGMTAFAQGQSCFADLWLLDLDSWQWRKLMPHNAQPPRPQVRDSDTQADIDAKLDAWEAELMPARRWDHTAFLMPTEGAGSGAGSGAESRSSAGSGSGSAPSSTALGLSANGRLAVFGGVSNASQTVNHVDVFDFSTLTWTRSASRLSGADSLEPLINIVDSGCLWLDMQARFNQTQPAPFAQPIVAVDADEMAGSGSGPSQLDQLLLPVAPAVSVSACAPGSSTSTGSGIDACIRLNMQHEQALFSRPTPLCQSSWVHFLVEGRVVSVPKLVAVSRCSTLLTAVTTTMRDRQMEQHGLMRVEGVRYVVFRAIVYFLYCGDLELVIRVQSAPSACNSARGVKRTNGELDGRSMAEGCGSSLAGLDSDDDAATEASLAQLGSLEIESGAAAHPAGQPNGKKRCRAKRMQADFEQQSHHPSLASHTPIPAESAPPQSPAPIPTPAVGSCAGAGAGAGAGVPRSSAPSPSPSSSPPSLVEYVIDPLELLVAGDRFNLSSLCSVVEIGLSRQLCVSAACKFLTFAETYHLRMLERLCHVFIIQRWEAVTQEHPDEYDALSAETRATIENGLDALAGSHRGPKNRNEPNPLLLPPGTAGSTVGAHSQSQFGIPAGMLDLAALLQGDDGDALDPAMMAMLGMHAHQEDEDEEEEEGEEEEEDEEEEEEDFMEDEGDD